MLESNQDVYVPCIFIQCREVVNEKNRSNADITRVHRTAMTPYGLRSLWREEFSQYNKKTFTQDLLAGITVGAVALPLALAFGIASGATAPAGLVTAIIAGIVIGIFSGAPYQISGPTGAMSAILIVLSNRYGLPGLWITGALSGVFLLLLGFFHLGRFLVFIPGPVIVGFTSGIAVIIAVGQIDNFLGVTTPTTESTAAKFLGYFNSSFQPNWTAVGISLLVVGCMLFIPKRISAVFPSSLLGLIIGTTLTIFFHLPIPTIGDIPTTLLLPERLTFASIPWADFDDFLVPALSVTALGAIESLLCGAVASNMTGIRLRSSQELIAQGLGNLLLPFCGGVPATAAIARTSVGIRAGGKTRLVSVFHSLFLLTSMLIFSSIMASIPLAALAGVLVVTAWRMNEWEAIHFYFSRRFKTAIATFAITLLVTVIFDLTEAILIGFALSAAAFVAQIAQLSINVREVDPEKLKEKGIVINNGFHGITVAYLTGPLFFAAMDRFHETFAHLGSVRCLILSMRGVPLIDPSGLKALEKLYTQIHNQGGTLMLSGVQEPVLNMLERGGTLGKIGKENFYWSSEQAILAASQLKPHQ